MQFAWTQILRHYSLCGRRSAAGGRSDHFGFSLFEMSFEIPCLRGGEDCSSSGNNIGDVGLRAQAWMKGDNDCAQFRSRRLSAAAFPDFFFILLDPPTALIEFRADLNQVSVCGKRRGVKNPNGSQADGGRSSSRKLL